MIKECVILNNKIINIGEWDYQYTEIEGEQLAQNPLPEGAIVEERDFEHDADRGWYEVGTLPIPTKEEILEQELANTNAMILELTEMILGGM